MTRLWTDHAAVFLFVSNHKFKKLAPCPPSWNKRNQYAQVAWWELFAPLPQAPIRIRSSRAGTPDFKWQGWSRSKEFLRFEIFDSRILLGRKNWQVFFWVAWFKTKTGKSKLKTTTKLIITCIALSFFITIFRLAIPAFLQYINCMSEWEWSDWERVVQKQ